MILRQDRDQLLRGGVPPITRPTLLPVAGSPRWRRVIYAMVDIEAVAVRLACGSALFIHHRPRLVRVQHGTYINVVNGCADFCASNDCVRFCVRSPAHSALVSRAPLRACRPIFEFSAKKVASNDCVQFCVRTRARSVPTFPLFPRVRNERVLWQTSMFIAGWVTRIRSSLLPNL